MAIASKAPLSGHSGVVQLSFDPEKGEPAPHPFQCPPLSCPGVGTL